MKVLAWYVDLRPDWYQNQDMVEDLCHSSKGSNKNLPLVGLWLINPNLLSLN